MGGAGSAAGKDLAFEGGASAVDADGSIGGSDAGAGGVRSKRGVVHLDAFEDGGVAGVKRVEGCGDAADRLLLRAGRRGRGVLEFAGQTLESGRLAGVAAVAVDDGVAEDAVEPGHGRLVVAQGGGGIEHAEVGALQDVFGEGTVVDAPLEEAEELRTEAQKRREGGRGQGARGGLLSGLVGRLDHSAAVPTLAGAEGAQQVQAMQAQAAPQAQVGPQGQEQVKGESVLWVVFILKPPGSGRA